MVQPQPDTSSAVRVTFSDLTETETVHKTPLAPRVPPATEYCQISVGFRLLYGKTVGY